jgi:hypothetical protein
MTIRLLTICYYLEYKFGESVDSFESLRFAVKRKIIVLGLSQSDIPNLNCA